MNTARYKRGETVFIMIVIIITYCFGITEVSFQQDSVATEKLVKRVADRISSFPDPDSFQHSGVTELTHAKLSVKQLRHRKDSDLHKCAPFIICTEISMFYLMAQGEPSFLPHIGLLVFIGFNTAYEIGLARG